MRIKIEATSNIKKAIDEEMRRYLVRVFDAMLDPFHAALREMVGEFVENTSVYKSLRNYGSLYGQIGLKNPKPSLDAIKSQIVESVFVDVLEDNKSVAMIFGVLPDDYSDILNLPEASYLSVTGAGRSRRVNWLEWLLLSGKSPVTPGYFYKTSLRGELSQGELARSRTRVGLMGKIGTTKVGRKEFGFDSPFAGTSEDNFLTRSLGSKEFDKRAAYLIYKIFKDTEAVTS